MVNVFYIFIYNVVSYSSYVHNKELCVSQNIFVFVVETFITAQSLL